MNQDSTPQSPYPKQRILSVDMLRGLTILAMIFVNKYHDVADRPQWNRHMPADADVLTFMDAVFPAFLFIVGMAMPFAMQARFNKGEGLLAVTQHSVIRGLSLVLVGVFMVNTYWGYDADAMLLSIHLWALLAYGCFILAWCQYPKHWSGHFKKILQWSGFGGLVLLAFLYQGIDGGGMTTQWWGIIGLIGLAYLLAAPVYLLNEKYSQKMWLLILAAVGLFALFVLLFPMKAESGSTLAWWLDQKIHITHAAIILLGTVFTQCFYHRDYSDKAYQYAVIFCLGILVAATLSWQLWPISKIWATPTWALWSIFYTCLVFLLLYWVIDTCRFTVWTKPFDAAANNSLFMYILPFIIATTERLFDFALRTEAFNAGLAGALWSVGFTLVVMALGAFLTRAGIRLKL